MSFQVGNNHYIGFYIETSGLTLSNFNVDIFTNDGITVDSVTNASLNIVEMGDGYYYATYTPSSPGTYYLGLSYMGQHIVDCEDIIASPSVINITQDTGGTNALRPILPTSNAAIGTTLSQYLLMIFRSSDWKVGRTNVFYAVGVTQLDDSGNWLHTPITVSPGQSYTVLIQNNAGITKVIQPNLEV